MPGQQLVQHDSQAEDVGAGVDAVRFAAGLLGTHVGRRAGKAAAVAEVFIRQRQPEIGDVGTAVGVQQDVRGLDVAVDEALRVSVVQRVGHGDDDADRFVGRQADHPHPSRQILPRNQLGNDVAVAVVGPAHVIDRDDRGMVQASDQASLGQVGLHVSRFGHAVPLRHFDRHIPRQLVVPRNVHAAETAVGQDAEHAIAADLVRRRFGRPSGRAGPDPPDPASRRASRPAAVRLAARGLVRSPVVLDALQHLQVTLRFRFGQGDADFAQFPQFVR